MIAIENPNAIITSKALIFLLEIFLIALFTIPIYLPNLSLCNSKGNQKENRRGFYLGSL